MATCLLLLVALACSHQDEEGDSGDSWDWGADPCPRELGAGPEGRVRTYHPHRGSSSAWMTIETVVRRDHEVTLSFDWNENYVTFEAHLDLACDPVGAFISSESASYFTGEDSGASHYTYSDPKLYVPHGLADGARFSDDWAYDYLGFDWAGYKYKNHSEGSVTITATDAHLPFPAFQVENVEMTTSWWYDSTSVLAPELGLVYDENWILVEVEDP